MEDYLQLQRGSGCSKNPRSFESATNPGSENSCLIEVGVFTTPRYHVHENQHSFSKPHKASKTLPLLLLRYRRRKNDPLQSAKTLLKQDENPITRGSGLRESLGLVLQIRAVSKLYSRINFLEYEPVPGGASKFHD